MSGGRLKVRGAALHAADLVPPLSKSDAHRALILADIVGAEVSLPPDDALPSDVRVLRAGLQALKAANGTDPVTLDCADGGAPLRFLIAQAALPPRRRVRFTGTARLGERPRGALLDSLERTLGPHGFLVDDPRAWPLELLGALETREPVFTVDATESGQFASSVLLAAARLAASEGRSWSMELAGGVTSAGYVDLTSAWLQHAGFAVTSSGSGWTVRKVGLPNALKIPGDWSSLGYLIALAWKTGGRVRLADLRSEHPDRAVVEILRASGAVLQPTGDGALAVKGALTRPLTASGKDCPDLLPTLAAIAVGAGVEATFSDVSVLRAKESDRVAGIERLVDAVGGRTTLEGDTLRVLPPSTVRSRFELDPMDDHRLAMSATVAALLGGAELVLSSPGCVAKSFPGFWDEVRRTGATLEEL